MTNFHFAWRRGILTIPKRDIKNKLSMFTPLALCLMIFSGGAASSADRLIGLHSAQVMSQSMPWIAQEAGLFKKYELDFRLVFIQSSPIATAATMSGDAEIGVTGAVGNVRAIVQGNTDLVFIGGMKNFLTHSIMGKADIKSPQDLKGKKVAVGRFGGNTHYFVIQALRRLGMDASRDIQMIQTPVGQSRWRRCSTATLTPQGW